MKPHRSSAASWYTACMINDHYEISLIPVNELDRGVHPIPELKATPEQLSRIIDLTTNVFEVAKLRPKLVPLQQRLGGGENTTELATQVAYFVQTLIEALELVPRYAVDEMGEETDINIPADIPQQSWRKLVLSKAATEATRAIFSYYTLTPRDAQRDASLISRKNDVARLIEVGIGVKKLITLLPKLRSWLEEMKTRNMTPMRAQKALRAVRYCIESLPSYENRQEEQRLLV